MCQKCKINNYEYDIFTFLEFPIEEFHKNITIKAQMLSQMLIFNPKVNKIFLKLLENGKKMIISLDDCFDFYLNYFKENYVCKKCSFINKMSPYINKLLELPNVFCIVLKRENNFKIKIEFPEELDISEYIENFVKNKKYELIGIISYLPENDIYFTISKNISDKQWYLYDKENVSKSNILEAKNKGIPYLLFYQMK